MLRIDKFLWAIRVYKTRSDASDACRNGHVAVNERQVKASAEVKMDDVVVVRKSPVHYHYKVVNIPTTRVGAKLVANFVQNITPQEELDKLNVNKMTVFAARDRGSGRPTKKERRDLENLLS